MSSLLRKKIKQEEISWCQLVSFNNESLMLMVSTYKHG